MHLNAHIIIENTVCYGEHTTDTSADLPMTNDELKLATHRLLGYYIEAVIPDGIGNCRVKRRSCSATCL
eukprot:6198811-Pleurochrysis_carterae.AAC.1